MSMYSKDIQLKKCSVSLRYIQLKTNSDCINLKDLSPFADDDGLPVSDEKYHATDSSKHKKIVSDISVERESSFENSDSDSGGSFKSLNSEDVSESEEEKSHSMKAGLKSPDIHSKKMLRKLSDASLHSAVDDEEKKEVKTCSVLLHDIGSELSSDSININDLPSDLKKSSDYKRKAVKKSTKDVRHDKKIKSDSSSESSDHEVKEIKRTKKLKKEKKSQKKAESDSSDDFISRRRMKKQQTNFFDLSDEDEDYDDKSTKKEKGNFKSVKKIGKSPSESSEEEMKLRKKKRVKYFQNSDSEEKDDASEKGSNSSEEDPQPVKRSKDWDPDFEDESSNSYKKSSQRKAAATKNMSEYEKMLEKNKCEKLALLESLGILKARDEISEAVKRMKKKDKVKKEKKTENIIRRSSKRSKTDINYNEENLKMAANQKLTVQSFKTVLKNKFHYKRFLDDLEELLESDTNVMPTPMLYDNNILNQLCHTASTKRIANPSALLWYPSADDLLLVVGTFNGRIIFWPMKDQFEFYPFPMHSKCVSHLKFNPYNSFQLFSSSLDGTLLCCDMQKQMFSQVFETDDDECTYFDFFSPSSLLVALKYDQIAIMDKRVRKSRGTSDSESNVFNKKWHTWDHTSISTVHVHPVHKNYFVTAGENNKVCLWDLRYLRQKPLLGISSYDDSVTSAFFSPVTGNFLLTTSLDAIVRVFDSTNLSEGFIKGYKALKYDNHPFQSWFVKASRAEWLPNSDDLFAFSYKQTPAKIQIYDKDFNDYAAIRDKISSARVCCTFHPFKCALASISQDKSVFVHT